MLPKLSKLIEDYARYGQVRTRAFVLEEAPMLAPIGRVVLQEGRASRLERADGSIGTMETVASEAEVSLKREDFNKYDEKAIERKRREMAKQFGRDTSNSMLKMISETAEQTGNSIDAKGRPFHEAFLEALERMPASDTGDAPMFVVHPDVAAKIMAERDAVERDPEVQKRLKEIYYKHEGERRARKANRRLVG